MVPTKFKLVVSKAVNAELDFTQEGHYTDQLRYNLTQSRWSEPKQLVIPKIYWHLTNSRLLVLEWLEGIQLYCQRIITKLRLG